jgi:AraC-like DNA-binding protein
VEGAVAEYVEYAPCEALREHVLAFFSFAPPCCLPPVRRVIREFRFGNGDSFCSPFFADSQVSIVFSFEQSCCADGRWHARHDQQRSDIIGPMSTVGTISSDERGEMVGVYLRPGQSSLFTGVPAAQLTDLVISLDDLRITGLSGLAADLRGASGVTPRIDLLESALLRRAGKSREAGGSVQVGALAEYIIRSRGRAAIEHLANSAGVSRQHLTRVFRERVGIPPKLFARLARFHAGLVYAGGGPRVDWAQAALELGYSDQSHMIAEFRQFSSLTPDCLGRRRWFHPFIERARDTRGQPGMRREPAPQLTTLPSSLRAVSRIASTTS